MLPAQRLNSVPEGFPTLNDAARSAVAFKQDGGDALRSFVLQGFGDLIHQRLVTLVGAAAAIERAPVRVWVVHAHDPRHSGLVCQPPRISPGAHRSKGGAVVSPIAGDDFLPARGQTGHFHGTLDPVRTAQREIGLVETAGSDLGQHLTQDGARFGGNARVSVGEASDLLLDRPNHVLIPVTDVDVEELGRPIQVALPIGIPKVDPLGLDHAEGIPIVLRGPACQRMGFVAPDQFVVVHG